MKVWLGLIAVLSLLAGCAATRGPAPDEPILASPEAKPAQPPASAPRAGGFYKDDGPGDNPPANLAAIPDAVPKREAPNRYANRAYTVFGASYVPISTGQGYKERGVASWYGKKFHGQKTSSGEVYDMYAMTGAHKTLPIPSYARVTNLANGRSVIVRINDRGPFHSDRIIDLSYAAAYKLGYASAGSARVEVEAIQPGDAPAEPPPAQDKPASEEKLQAAEATPATAETGIFLQVGAFSSRQNADDLRSRIARQLAWLTDSVQVLSIGNLWRLRVGPYGTSDAARAIAERIEAELNLKPLVVTR
jgi:rare lipoprotein A